MKRSLLILLILIGTITLALVYRSYLQEVPQKAFAQTTTLPSDTDWFTLGGNYQRTSWVNSTTENQTEVRGNLNVEWYQPIEPYIPYKVQPILTNDTAYISTSKGLYAFDLNSTSTQTKVKWVYPTELPLGHSPTVVTVNNILTAYVGGYDKKIHAVDANTGQPISGYTPYEAEAGFETNPLVINGIIYVGNRDGKFYALNAVTGDKIWEFPTGGPILFSAAYNPSASSGQGALYFASNDNHAYALNATTGEQIWKQGPFLGQGFHSFWPVIYTDKTTQKDYVVFSGSENYRSSDMSLTNKEGDELLPDKNTVSPGTIIGPVGTEPGDWALGTVTMDLSRITEYFEEPTAAEITADPAGLSRITHKPWRRTVFVLDITNGQEYSFDSDGDGQNEYAPFSWNGVTHAGSRYPALIGKDGVLYQDTGYHYTTWILGGYPVGWKFGTQYASRVEGDAGGNAADEPMAFSSAGNLVYWSLCCDREAGSFDITIPFGQPNRFWNYYGYNLQSAEAPDYREMYNNGILAQYNDMNGWVLYSGKNQSVNGVYSIHGTTQSPPISHKGKLYMLRANALLAWSPTATTPVKVPVTDIVNSQSSITVPAIDSLRQKLEAEIQKMVNAGHLRPGYHAAGFIDLYGQGGYDFNRGYGELFDYFQNPAETVVTLTQALPYLSPALQDQVKTYLQTNYGPGAPYDFTSIVHIGWQNGAAREAFDIPPDQLSKYSSFAPRTTRRCSDCGWVYPPYSFYAAWKYADVIGNKDQTSALNLFNTISNKLNLPPGDEALVQKPYILNQFIAGYLGFLELQKLAGLPESTSVRNTYNRLLDLRVNRFTKDSLFAGAGGGNSAFNYMNTLSIARNYMYLTPELGSFLNQNAQPLVEESLNEYQYVAPYWFVSKYDNSYGEGTLDHLYNYPSLFQAKAYALKEPYTDLVKYLDVPAFQTGDLFYLQNITAALEAASATTPPSPALCTLNNLSWPQGISSVEVEEGSEVKVTVFASGNCSGKQADLTVRRNVSLGFDSDAANQPNPRNIKLVLNTGSNRWEAASTWTADSWNNDSKYFVKANLTGDSTEITTDRNSDLTITQSPPAGIWYDQASQYRKEITIDHTKVASSEASLANFPILINVNDPDFRDTLNGGKVVNSSGNDFVFTTGKAAKLDHEIEKYDPVTGLLIAWVKIPKLSSSEDTSIYLYFGNSNASDQQNPGGIWSDNFAGVWHLNNNNLNNSTEISGLDGTNVNNNADLPSAKIAGGRSFSSSTSDNDYIQVSDNDALDTPTNLTVQAWVRLNNLNTAQEIVSGRDYFGGQGYHLLQYCPTSTTCNFTFQIYDGGGQAGPTFQNTASSANTWYHVVGTYDGSNVRVYVNGVANNTSALFHNAINPSDNPLRFGIDAAISNQFDLDGDLDEVRISNTVRSAGWITTEYNNQSSPSTFSLLGNTESPSGVITNADLNSDNLVDLLDIKILLDNWGTNYTNPKADLNLDRRVNGVDFALLMKDWGKTN